LELCELDYWNGRVLNVAHGLIPVCMELMHVFMQHPVRMVSCTDCINARAPGQSTGPLWATHRDRKYTGSASHVPTVMQWMKLNVVPV
jgi:hypothetical protein